MPAQTRSERNPGVNWIPAPSELGAKGRKPGAKNGIVIW